MGKYKGRGGYLRKFTFCILRTSQQTAKRRHSQHSFPSAKQKREKMRAISFAPLLIALASATADPTPVPVSAPAPAPTPTPAASPVLSAAELARRVITTTIYTPTEWWDYSTTSISKDEYFLGIQSVTGVDGGLCIVPPVLPPWQVIGFHS